MKETLVLTLKLFIITTVVAVLLGTVNMITEPIIAENTIKATNDTMKELLPDADKFDLDGTEIPEPKESGVIVGDVNCGMKSDGTVVGYVISAVCQEGYGGDISVMVSIDNDCKVIKAKVTAMDETPGLGAKSQSDWIDGYDGLGQGIEVNKNGSADSAEYKIDAISGATITSKAVTKAVNATLDAARVVIDDNSGLAVLNDGETTVAEDTEVIEDTEKIETEDIENAEEAKTTEDDAKEGGAE